MVDFNELVKEFQNTEVPQIQEVEQQLTETQTVEEEEEEPKKPPVLTCINCGREYYDEYMADTDVCVSCGENPRVSTDLASVAQGINTRVISGSATLRHPIASDFQKILKALNSILDEVVIRFDYQGIHVAQMEPAHIAMVVWHMPPTALYEYTITNEPLLCSVDLRNLIKCFKNIDKKYEITMQYTFSALVRTDARGREEVEEGTKDDKLTVLFQSADGRRKKFDVETLDVTHQEIEPKLAFEAKAVVSIDTLLEAIQDVEPISESITFTIDSYADSLTVSAKGEDRRFEMVFNRGESITSELVNNTSQPVKASFSISYLEKILKGGRPLSDDVILYLSTNRPAKIQIPTYLGELYFLLAPRLED